MPAAKVPFPLRGSIQRYQCVIDVDFFRCGERESRGCPNILCSTLKFFPNRISHEENMVRLLGFGDWDGHLVVEVVVWGWAREGGGTRVVV